MIETNLVSILLIHVVQLQSSTLLLCPCLRCIHWHTFPHTFAQLFVVSTRRVFPQECIVHHNSCDDTCCRYIVLQYSFCITSLIWIVHQNHTKYIGRTPLSPHKSTSISLLLPSSNTQLPPREVTSSAYFPESSQSRHILLKTSSRWSSIFYWILFLLL